MKRLFIILAMILSSVGAFAQTRPSITGIVPIENIAALKALKPTESGTWAYVAGYYTRGDGGGGDFFWDSSNTRPSNDGTVVAATGVTNGRWLRSVGLYDPLDAKWFGIFPEFQEIVTPTDQSTRIQTLIDSADGQRDILFSTGSYGIGTSLHPPIIDATSVKTLSIRGGGSFGNHVTQADGFIRKTIFRALPGIASGQAIINLSPDGRGTFWGVNIDGVTFRGSDINAGQVGIIGKFLTYSSITRSQFSNLNIGVSCADASPASKNEQWAFYTIIKDTTFIQNNVGFIWRGIANNLSFNNCKFISHSNIGLDLAMDNTGAVVFDSYFEGNTNYDISVVDSGGFKVMQSWFEGAPLAHIRYSESALADTGQPFLSVTNNFFRNAATPTATILELSSVMQNEERFYSLGALPVTFAFNHAWNKTPYPAFPDATSTLYLAKLTTDSASSTVAIVNSIGNYFPAHRFEYTPSVHLKNRIAIFGDGPYGKFKLIDTLPTFSATYTIQLPYYPGSLKYNSTTGKFQGVASTTTGWVDL